LSEELCQCPDCQRFYKEHDRLIREFPTLKQQQECSWTALQAFRTLCSKVLDELQKSYIPSSFSEMGDEKSHLNDSHTLCEANSEAIKQAISDLENINAHLYSMEALMERIFDVRVPDKVESKFREVAGELAPDPLNIDRILLNRLFHQTPDFPDKKNNPN
tara:strand:+ start:1278 stop:1760 length:483 start_codon:yes stop_codon:yes gene_type:complete